MVVSRRHISDITGCASVHIISAFSLGFYEGIIRLFPQCGIVTPSLANLTYFARVEKRGGGNKCLVYLDRFLCVAGM